jgi:hypothetical protein
MSQASVTVEVIAGRLQLIVGASTVLVTTATENSRTFNNTFSPFIDEACVLVNGGRTLLVKILTLIASENFDPLVP